MDRSVSLVPLKVWARSNLHGCPVLRSIVLDEPDRVSTDELASKAVMWLRVLAKERQR